MLSVGELRKRRNVVQDFITNPGIKLTEVKEGVARYEKAFCNFVSSHDNYLPYEDDEEKIALTNDSYDSQRDMKLQLDILVGEWREKKKRELRPLSEYNFSQVSARSVKSSALSAISVKERKKLMEEAKLEIRALKEKQELQRELERVEKGKAELNRKLELVDAKTKLQQTEIDLMLEQTFEKDTDGMNDYFEEYYMQNNVKEELSPPVGETGATSSSESKLVDNRVIVSDEQLQSSQIQSHSSPLSVQVSVGTETVATLSSVPHIAPKVGLRSSASIAPKESQSLVSSLTQHSPYLTTTSVPDTIQPPLYTIASLSPASFQSTPACYCAPRTSLTATATEFYPAFVSQQNPPLLLQYPYLSPQSLASAQQSEAWTTIAQAIKQGPSLPKVELMKFNGDPLEYVEFVTNFIDNIESQVADESQKTYVITCTVCGKS